MNHSNLVQSERNEVDFGKRSVTMHLQSVVATLPRQSSAAAFPS